MDLWIKFNVGGVVTTGIPEYKLSQDNQSILLYLNKLRFVAMVHDLREIDKPSIVDYTKS